MGKLKNRGQLNDTVLDDRLTKEGSKGKSENALEQTKMNTKHTKTQEIPQKKHLKRIL